jgi:hypothetical protein
MKLGIMYLLDQFNSGKCTIRIDECQKGNNMQAYPTYYLLLSVKKGISIDAILITAASHYGHHSIS